VAVGNDRQWQQFCTALERTDLAENPRWAKVTGRITGRNELIPDVARTMLTRTAADWVARLEGHGVPCGRINDYREVFEEPQVRHRGLRVDLPNAQGGVTGTIASPLRLQGTPPVYRGAPPSLGNATDEVLGTLLKKTSEEIERYRASKVI